MNYAINKKITILFIFISSYSNYFLYFEYLIDAQTG